MATFYSLYIPLLPFLVERKVSFVFRGGMVLRWSSQKDFGGVGPLGRKNKIIQHVVAICQKKSLDLNNSFNFLRLLLINRQ